MIELGTNVRPSERGQSLVELMVSITFMLVLLAGIVDFGRAFFVYMELRDAAQEGAIYGSAYPNDPAGIVERVRKTSRNPIELDDTSIVTVNQSFPDGSDCKGNGVEVIVSYEFPITMPFLGAIIGEQSFPLSASATDTILRSTC